MLVNHAYAVHAHQRAARIEHSAEDAAPRRVVREEHGDLGDGEDEREVEEELERSDLVLRVDLGLAVRLGHATTLDD